MEKFDIAAYVRHGSTISGNDAYQLKRNGFIDSSFHFVEADDIDALIRGLENLRSYFIYKGRDLAFVSSEERLEFDYINVMYVNRRLNFTMAYRPTN